MLPCPHRRINLLVIYTKRSRTTLIDNTSEKRKVGSSTLPLTTRLTSQNAPADNSDRGV